MLAPGHFSRVIEKAEADLTSAPIGADPRLAEVVWERWRAARWAPSTAAGADAARPDAAGADAEAPDAARSDAAAPGAARPAGVLARLRKLVSATRRRA